MSAQASQDGAGGGPNTGRERDAGRVQDAGPEQGGGREQSGVGVLDKAFELLDALAVGGELSAAELARALGEPRATVYRLLASLQVHGAVDPGTRRGSFRLGLGLIGLSRAVLARLDVRTAALPAMTRLHEQTRETVFLCIRSQGSAVCVERLDGLDVQSLAMKLGGSLPLHVGAAGVALLCAEPAAEQARYLDDATLAPMTPRGHASRAEIEQVLALARRRGYAVSDEDVTVGIAALGAVVRDHSARPVAAVSLSGIRELIVGAAVREQNIARVCATAAEIAAALGYAAPAAPGAEV